MLSLAKEAEQLWGGGGERVERLVGWVGTPAVFCGRLCMRLWMFGGGGGGGGNRVFCIGRYHTSDLTVHAKQQRETQGWWGFKPVWVTLAGYQEGLNLDFLNMSLGTCRDSDAKPRPRGLGSWPGEAAYSEKHPAKALDLRLEGKEAIQGQRASWFSRFHFLPPCPVRLLHYKHSVTVRG